MICFGLLSTHCGRSGFTPIGNEEPDANPSPLETTVTPLFATNGANWNDYVQRPDLGTEIAHLDDIPCDGTSINGSHSCIHGGERRQVEVSSATQCGGLMLVDALDAFRWRCVTDQGTVKFISIGLREEVHLIDLIDLEKQTWKPNSVTITDSNSNQTWQTVPTSWWSNPISIIGQTTGTVTLDQSGTIFVLDESVQLDSLEITADKVGLVMDHGVALSHSGDPTLNCLGATQTCILQTSGVQFAWLEGTVDSVATPHTDIGLLVEQTSFSTLRHFAAHQVGNIRSVLMTDSNANRIHSSAIAEGRGRGLEILNSHVNEFYKFFVSNTLVYGIWSSGSERNVFRKIRVSTSGHAAFLFAGVSHATILVEALASNNNSAGINFGNGAPQSVISHALVVGGNSWGFRASGNSTSAQIAVLGNDIGLSIRPSDSDFTNMAVGRSVTTSVETFNVTHRNSFHGALLFGTPGTTSCQIDPAASQPALDGTCQPINLSDATAEFSVDMQNSLVGPVTSDEANASDLDGVASAGSIALVDRYRFDHFLRNWAFPSLPNDLPAGYCEGATNCHIWDYRLRKADTGLRNRNGVFVPGQACPPSVSGDATAPGATILTEMMEVESPGINGDEDGGCEASEACTFTELRFLTNATEIMFDDIGNDNGLCESFEHCTFSPNIGVYQGEGPLHDEPCIFDDGNPSLGGIEGVVMRAYSINGVQ